MLASLGGRTSATGCKAAAASISASKMAISASFGPVCSIFCFFFFGLSPTPSAAQLVVLEPHQGRDRYQVALPSIGMHEVCPSLQNIRVNGQQATWRLRGAQVSERRACCPPVINRQASAPECVAPIRSSTGSHPNSNATFQSHTPPVRHDCCASCNSSTAELLRTTALDERCDRVR